MLIAKATPKFAKGDILKIEDFEPIGLIILFT